MIRVKRDICIQVPDDLVLDVLERLISRIESLNLGSEAAVLPLGHLYQGHPRILFKITTHDFWRLVRRAVVHDNPLQRKMTLMNNGLDGLVDEGFLVSGWR